jgi:hypothetical protein
VASQHELNVQIWSSDVPSSEQVLKSACTEDPARQRIKTYLRVVLLNGGKIGFLIPTELVSEERSRCVKMWGPAMPD